MSVVSSRRAAIDSPTQRFVNDPSWCVAASFDASWQDLEPRALGYSRSASSRRREDAERERDFDSDVAAEGLGSHRMTATWLTGLGFDATLHRPVRS